MVTTPIKSQRLAARNDSSEQDSWTPIQIATPAIVGGVLILIFAAYIIWKRYPLRKRSYDYQEVRPEWVNKVERMLVPRRTRMRVLHSSGQMTLDESMRTLSLDFRRARQYRCSSTESQAPLTSTNDTFDNHPFKNNFNYPPNNCPSDSMPPIPRSRWFRWWWLLGSRPQEIKSAEPSLRWRVDGPDGSSSGHDHSSHGHEAYSARYAALEAVQEDREETDDDVIPIGENFASIASTPITQHFPEQARAIHGVSPLAEHLATSGVHTTAPAANALQSPPGTPGPANPVMPPSYDISQRQTRFAASADDIVRPTRSDPSYMVIPPPVRTASPRVFHGRENSTDSFLATQPPMVITSIY